MVKIVKTGTTVFKAHGAYQGSSQTNIIKINELKIITKNNLKVMSKYEHLK